MRLLADTHLLIWTAISSGKLSASAKGLLEDPGNEVFFSTVSIWETAIKQGRGYPDFAMDAAALRNGLLRSGFPELPIISEQVIGVANLPPIHRDPFDRLLVAQAQREGLLLITADVKLASYSGVRRV